MTNTISLESISLKIDQLGKELTSHVDVSIEASEKRLGKRIDDLEQKIQKKIEEKIDELAFATAKGFREVDQQFVVVNKKFVAIDKRFDEVDKKFQEVNDKMDNIKVDLSKKMDKQQEITRQILVSHNRRIIRVEFKLGIA